MNVSETEKSPFDEIEEPVDLEQEIEDDLEEGTRSLIAELERERDELKDQLLRALADLQNLRKRHQQEREDIRRFATEQLVRELLPVLDNFERTLAAMDSGADPKAVSDGIRLVDRQLRSALQSVKLGRIQATGKPFDPELHDAVASVPTHDFPDDTVVEELEPGYQMAGRTIRPARVRVARTP